MISANEARNKVNSHDERVKALNYCKKWIEYYINEAIRKGKTQTYLTPDYTYVNDRLYDCEDDLISWLKSNGYHIKNKEYGIGKYICW